MDIKELQAMREPVLSRREANRDRDENMDGEVEAECNAELCRLNMAIQGVQPYEEPKKAVKRRKKVEAPKRDVLA